MGRVSCYGFERTVFVTVSYVFGIWEFLCMVHGMCIRITRGTKKRVKRKPDNRGKRWTFYFFLSGNAEFRDCLFFFFFFFDFGALHSRGFEPLVFALVLLVCSSFKCIEGNDCLFRLLGCVRCEAWLTALRWRS